MVLPAGYYEETVISTDIRSLPGTITYTHHQCSNTSRDVTYTDNTISTTNAAAVSETVINGQKVSTTQGGCYTTPYYVWTTTKAVHVDAVYTTHSFTYQDTGNGTGRTICTRCGMVIGTGTESTWGGNTCKVRDGYDTTVSETHYSTSMPSAAHSTYYLKTCGHTNGELLSVTITY